MDSEGTSLNLSRGKAAVVRGGKQSKGGKKMWSRFCFLEKERKRTTC